MCWQDDRFGEGFLWSSSIAQSSTDFMCVNDRQWWNRVQQKPKPSNCDWANYRGIYALCSYSSDDLTMLLLFLTLSPIYFVLCIMPVMVFSVVSLLTCLIPQHSLVLMFSFSFKESQERKARKVDVFDFGKWVDASCKGNKIYHRGLLRGRVWKILLICDKRLPWRLLQLDQSETRVSLFPLQRLLCSCFFWKRTSSILKEIQGSPNVLFAFRPSTWELCIGVTLQRG